MQNWNVNTELENNDQQSADEFRKQQKKRRLK